MTGGRTPAELLAPLRPNFVARCQDNLAALRRGLDEGFAGDDELESLCHGLAGLASLFGHPELAEAARTADGRFAVGEQPTRRELDEVVRLLADVR
jgi:HPt (histidine-containing phosphotransfer) domain-containing protein